MQIKLTYIHNWYYIKGKYNCLNIFYTQKSRGHQAVKCKRKRYNYCTALRFWAFA